MVLRFVERLTGAVEELGFDGSLLREWGQGVISLDGPDRPQVRTKSAHLEGDKLVESYGDYYTFKYYSSHWMRGTEDDGDCMYFSLFKDSGQGFLIGEATYVWNPRLYDVYILSNEGKTYQKLG